MTENGKSPRSVLKLFIEYYVRYTMRLAVM